MILIISLLQRECYKLNTYFDLLNDDNNNGQ